MIIQEHPIKDILRIQEISIAFRVESVFHVQEEGPVDSVAILKEEPVQTPYIKDYDDHPDEGPEAWMNQFDLSNWGLILAQEAGATVGSALIAFDTVGVDMLKGGKDLAVLWDFRIQPEYRHRGLGSRLFEAAEAWSGKRQCDVLQVETQNINVPACRFYEKKGCQLQEINFNVYAEFPHEIQLIWEKKL